MSALGTARIGQMCTQSCTQDPRVYLLAVVKSDTNAEGESFVGLHTLTCRARQLGKRHISALGNAHHNDYMEGKR